MVIEDRVAYCAYSEKNFSTYKKYHFNVRTETT